ncbi:enoyl-CoA hydratase/isomerase family protein [Cupriavidus sp. BIC8F]|uniref:enoyl-CoA hydratase/isomerase family protein n=1 Tax=Cupriavidus sp. BIC8F TaxID=3079014 RepID=UPI00291656CD|nr:enoyl-CoA hydratase/isomerase family protein [Cupriavidus sp. BIC8F]
MSSPLHVERTQDVWTLKLQRPEKRNALSYDMVEALLDAVQDARDRRVPVLVLQGAGKNFSAGFDFSDLSFLSDGDLLLRFVRIELLLQAFATSPCLTLGLAHGKNFGAGVDLLAVCRHRVATEEATFRMPGLKFGLVLGTRRFASIVGKEKATDILSNSKTFSASEAKSIGFIHEVSEQDRWAEAIHAASATGSILSPASRADLYAAVSDLQANADLACLVRSAALPGIKERVASHLARSE